MAMMEVSDYEAMQLIAQDPMRYTGMLRTSAPEGERGNWRIRRFTVTEEAYTRQLVDQIHGLGMRAPPAGEYTSLDYRNAEKKSGWAVMMSDTPAEMADHIPAIRFCKGRVLITGLGLAMVAEGLCRRPAVESVTVVEKDADVIALMQDYLRDEWDEDRLRIVHADAFTWKADRKFDTAWHDIWPTISDENLPEMYKLRKRYPARWTGFWAEKQCRSMKAFIDKPSRETALKALPSL